MKLRPLVFLPLASALIVQPSVQAQQERFQILGHSVQVFPIFLAFLLFLLKLEDLFFEFPHLLVLGSHLFLVFVQNLALNHQFAEQFPFQSYQGAFECPALFRADADAQQNIVGGLCVDQPRPQNLFQRRQRVRRSL